MKIDNDVVRLFRNLGHLLGGKAAAGVISLVYLVIVARSLGAVNYGVLTLVNGYVTLVGSVIAFSGFHGLVRYGTQALKTGDHGRLKRIIRFTTAVELGCGAVAILVAATLAPLIGPRLGWSADTVRLAVPFSFAVLATVRATPYGLLQIAGRFDLIGLHQTISPLVRLIGALAVWLCAGGLRGFLIVWLAAAVAEGASMWLLGLFALRRLRLSRAPRGLGSIGTENPGLVRFMLLTNLDITLRELAPNLGPLTVGWFLGPAATGLLNLCQRATSVLQQPAALLWQASYGTLAEQSAGHDWSRLGSTVRRSAGLTLLAALPVLLLMVAFAQPILELLGGDSFEGGVSLLALLAVARAATLVAQPFAAALVAVGRATTSVTVSLLTNLLPYPALPLLLLFAGLKGAGWYALMQGLATMGLTICLFARALRVLETPLPQGREGGRAAPAAAGAGVTSPGRVGGDPPGVA